MIRRCEVRHRLPQEARALARDLHVSILAQVGDRPIALAAHHSLELVAGEQLQRRQRHQLPQPAPHRRHLRRALLLPRALDELAPLEPVGEGERLLRAAARELQQRAACGAEASPVVDEEEC